MRKKEKVAIWVATFYNKEKKILYQHITDKKTEYEAFIEVEKYMPKECYEWTLTEQK